ncbi:hypothetical protein [Bacteroides sp. GM023]|uniref:hypothetical protein n=1 Tax=Bacteroides sp. GM023 TaxID=2723058 RepID=UPI00168C0DDC|nr:hypothetical protein [Bacteroides sp. GM023]MBD3592722.1 hypothetical protein [Bacteroides sp. GM023]
MKQIIFILLFVLPISVYGNSSDSIKIEKVQKSIIDIVQSIERMQVADNKTGFQISEIYLVCDSLQEKLSEIQKELNGVSCKLGGEIIDTQKIVKEKTEIFSENIQSRTVYGIVGFIIVLIIAVSVYWILHKRISYSTSMIDKVREAQNNVQEESVKLDNKLMELLNRQLDIQKIQSNTVSCEKNGNPQVDHSLALKVADEIVRIEINLSRMDPSVKGYKQLNKAVERIKDNFLANNYEMVDMLGKAYNDGMKVIVNFLSDESLKDGEQIITGIIKPQINYKGQMIQTAQVTVSQNI